MPEDRIIVNQKLADKDREEYDQIRVLAQLVRDNAVEMRKLQHAKFNTDVSLENLNPALELACKKRDAELRWIIDQYLDYLSCGKVNRALWLIARGHPSQLIHRL